MAESHPKLQHLTVLDLSEVGGEFHAMCEQQVAKTKLSQRKRATADPEAKEAARLAETQKSLAEKRWKDRLLQLFENLRSSRFIIMISLLPVCSACLKNAAS